MSCDRVLPRSIEHTAAEATAMERRSVEAESLKNSGPSSFMAICGSRNALMDRIGTAPDTTLPEQSIVSRVTMSHGTVQAEPLLAVLQKHFAWQQQVIPVFAGSLEVAVLARPVCLDPSRPAIRERDVKPVIARNVSLCQ